MEGLKHKYDLRKANGRPVDPHGAYFVLKLNSKDEDHRQASQEAALAYANRIEGANPQLAADLREAVEALRK